MSNSTGTPGKLSSLSGGGEMGKLTRNYNWSATPLGEQDTWPQSLLTTLSIILHSKFPMFLFWGADSICFYNDAYRPSLGTNGKHPYALGKKAEDIWPEIWDVIAPLIKNIMAGGEASWNEDQLLPIERNGQMEQVYWTFSYSPVKDEAGNIAGVFVTCTETTEKILSLKRLQSSENSFKDLIQNSSVGSCLLTGKGMVISVINNTMINYFGKGNNVLHKRLEDVLPELKEQHIFDILQNVYNSNTSFKANEALINLVVDGRLRENYFDFIFNPVCNAEGRVYGVVCISVEVTEKILARKKIENSELRFKNLIEEATVASSLYVGKDMIIEVANKAILNYWGKDKSVIGKKLKDAIPEIAGQPYLQILNEVFYSGVMYEAKDKPAKLIVDGKEVTRYFDFTYKPLRNADNEVFGIMSTVVNVTEKVLASKKMQESERNLRQTILQAPAAMCILRGPSHIVELANTYMIDFWGKKTEEVIGKPLVEAIPEIMDQGYEDIMNEVYLTGNTYVAQGIPVTLHKNGADQHIFMNLIYKAYLETDGKIFGIICLAIDVTAEIIARQKIEEVVAERTKELADANKDLQRSNAELSQFAYIASHDLQEPLRKIHTFTQMLENRIAGSIDEQSKNYLNKIYNSSSRMNTLIRDVLTYSGLIKDLEIFKQTDLNEILKNNIVDYELLITEKEATITFDVLPVIEAIPLQMSQLFSNLISNALKFSRKDIKPLIEITIAILSSKEKKQFPFTNAGTWYVITFRDNGIGFEKEYAKKIFNIFQRLHGKSEYEGTGIGLAMCKKIVLNHQGEINAVGSTTGAAIFNIILPAVQ